jgi:hypothetical protein
MFYGISWTLYFECLSLLLAFYYLVAGTLFFRAEMRSLLNSVANRSSFSEEEDSLPEVENNALLIIREIKPLFKRKIQKEELIYSIKLNLTRYDQWDEPGFRETINAFIMGESERKCSIHLSEEDLRVLWI